MDDVAAVLDSLDWRVLAGRALGSPPVDVLSRAVLPVMLGAGAGTQVHRVEGTASTATGPAAWSLVVKLFTTVTEDFQSLSSDPRAWNYLRREWDVYGAAWIGALDGPVRAARALDRGEIRLADGSPVAWVVLEDLREDDRRPWRLDDFRTAAAALGEFNGSHPAGSVPADPWLSRGWLAGYVEEAGAVIEQLRPAAVAIPDLGRIYPDEAVAVQEQVWRERRRLLAATERLPTVLAHHDFFPRNVFLRRAETGTQAVAVDWAFCGLAPIGTDLATLVGASEFFGELRGTEAGPIDTGELEEVCLAAYGAGLSRVGVEVAADDLRLGYRLTVVLRFLGALPAVLALVTVEEVRVLIPALFGMCVEEFVDNTASLSAGIVSHQRWIDRTLAER